MEKQSIKTIEKISTSLNSNENKIAASELQKVKGGLIGVFIIGALNP